jgi:hypothetical protein
VAALITLSIVIGIAGVLVGAYLRICFAIRREDRSKGSLRFDPPSPSTQTARSFVGMNSSRWG